MNISMFMLRPVYFAKDKEEKEKKESLILCMLSLFKY
jgi:hypothetical protein